MSERSNRQRPQPIKKGTGYPVSLDRRPPASKPSGRVNRNAMYPTSIDSQPRTTGVQPTKLPPKSSK